MARIEAAEAEQQAAIATAVLIAAGARTAPKTRGVDSLRTLILVGEDLGVLAGAMEAKADGEVKRHSNFSRDASNVRASVAVVLFGVTGEPKKPEQPLNCGACGYGGCDAFITAGKNERLDFRGPLCIYQLIDLDIALGVAAKISAEKCIDSRIMYTIGAAARKAGYLKECDVVMGLPLSVTGKNPFFRPRASGSMRC